MHRLRWRLCKIFRKPVDDNIFKQTNDAQYVWYQMQSAIDDEERFEFMREIAEHNAMFWNPEGVDQVRNARENTFKTSEQEFDKSLEELFGRKMPTKPQDEQQLSDEDMIQITKENPYLDMDLDEISFIPAKGD